MQAEKPEKDSRGQLPAFVAGKKDGRVGEREMDAREGTDHFEHILSGEATEICGNGTGARGEDSKGEVVKRVAEITDPEFNYTGEMESFTVEDGRTEGGDDQCSLQEVVLLWYFLKRCWVYPKAETEDVDVEGISKD